MGEPPATAFVTGGAGLVGTPVVEMLLARGTLVTALARSDAAAAALRAAGAQVVRGDLSAPGPWARSAGEADVVIHAGLPRMAPPVRGRHVRRLARLAAEQAAGLADAAQGGVIVAVTCGLADDAGPLRIAIPSRSAEDALRGPETRVVRVPWVYGPAGVVRDMSRGVQMRRLRIVGPGTNPMPLVGARDAADGVLAAAAASAGTYAVREPSVPTQIALVHHLCAGRGAPRPDHAPPRLAALSMGGVMSEALAAFPVDSGAPPPGFACAQRWDADLLDALIPVASA